MTNGAGGEVSLSGFSSRSTSNTITQFPQRDEALMYDMEPGFSNSKAVKSDDQAEAKAVKSAESEAKVVESEQVEDKAVKPAKKAAAKKTAKKS